MLFKYGNHAWVNTDHIVGVYTSDFEPKNKELAVYKIVMVMNYPSDELVAYSKTKEERDKAFNKLAMLMGGLNGQTN